MLLNNKPLGELSLDAAGFGQVGGRYLQEPGDDVPLVAGTEQLVAAEVAREVPALSAATAELGQFAGATFRQQPAIIVGALWSGAEGAEIGDALELPRKFVHREEINDVARYVVRLLLIIGLLTFASFGSPPETEI